MSSPLARLDAYGTDDPDFNEGHPEDRCPLCEWPVIDHRTWPPRRGQLVAWRAKWPHRRAALLDMISTAIGRPLR